MTVVTLVLPWQRLPRLLGAVAPVLDIAALGLSSLDSAGWAVAPLLVLPVLWLAGTFHRVGALGAGLAAVLFFGVPSTLYLGTDGGTLAWSVLVPVAVTALGLAFVEGIDRLNADRDEVARQRLALQEAALTIDKQRLFADAILDTVDVGLVLLDHTGARRTRNARHEELMRLAFPDGRSAPAYFAYEVDGVTSLASAEMPEQRAIRGEEFDDCLIWVGEDPKNRRALSVSARTVRDGAGGLVGATLAYKDVTEFMRRAAGQGRVRGVGLPRAAYAADLDPWVRRPRPRPGRHRRLVARVPPRWPRATASGCNDWSPTCCTRCRRTPARCT